MNDRILKIYELLADDFLFNEKILHEYLEEEVTFDNVYNEKMKPILDKIMDYKLSIGRKRQNDLNIKFSIFKKHIEGMTSAKIIEIYPPLAQTAFSKLSEENIGEIEIEQLLVDGSFLAFLENYPDDKPE